MRSKSWEKKKSAVLSRRMIVVFNQNLLFEADRILINTSSLKICFFHKENLIEKALVCLVLLQQLGGNK